MHQSCPLLAADLTLLWSTHWLTVFWPHPSPNSAEKDRLGFTHLGRNFVFSQGEQKEGRWAKKKKKEKMGKGILSHSPLGQRRVYFCTLHCVYLLGFYPWHSISQPTSRVSASVHTGWWCPLSSAGKKSQTNWSVECTRPGLMTLVHLT